MNNTPDSSNKAQPASEGSAAPEQRALVPVPADLSATERLALSRDLLRQTMLDSSSGKPRRPRGKPGEPVKRSGLLDGLGAIPGADVLIDTVRHWWARHPMRLVTMVAGDATKGMLRPIAKNNPIGLVAGAVVVGALFVWIRPWRRIIRPALFAGLLPQLLKTAMTKMPVEAWVSKAAGMMNKTSAPIKAAAQQRSPATAPKAATRSAAPSAGAPAATAPQRSTATASTPKPARTLP